MRRKILSEISDESIRRDILQRIAGLDMLGIVKEKGVAEAKKKILRIISEKIHRKDAKNAKECLG